MKGYVTSEESLKALCLSMYIDEPCRICGKPIRKKDVDTAVYAGYSNNNKARSAHDACWEKHQHDKTTWKHQ